MLDEAPHRFTIAVMALEDPDLEPLWKNIGNV
jgi:hypothetical protein